MMASIPSEHAKLSASGAHRWLYCTPAAELESQYPDKDSVYTIEGSIAHELAALKLQKYFTPMSTRTYNNRKKKIEKLEGYTEEMDACTDTYLEYIKSIVVSLPSTPYAAIEQRVSYDQYVPDGFGTADSILIHGDTLWITDYKHGKGVPVEAEHNEQLQLYALGAIQSYAFLYTIKHIVLSIIQPRTSTLTPNTWTIEADKLLDWGENFVKPRAALAYNGKGEFNPGEKTCRFCKAKAVCRARAEKNLELARNEFAPPRTLSYEEIGGILTQAKDLKAWVSDLEEYALNEALSGQHITGWKLVEGRSTRRFLDADAAFDKLIAAGVDRELLYVRKPITLAETEKLIGKKRFSELLATDVEKPRGKPALVPETDSRVPYTTAKDDFFKEEA